MPIKVDDEEYYTVAEACEYLGNITPQTLRNRAKANGVLVYKQGVAKNVYYRKSDLDRLKAFRPVSRNDEQESE